MKAITRTTYGPPDVLTYEDRPEPEPGPGQVLVQVAAASINRGDALELRGWPRMARLTYGLRRPRRPVPGTDVAGTVVRVGPAVSGLSVGQQVVGWGDGAFAERSAADGERLLPLPAGMSEIEAAAVPTAGVAALQAVRDRGRVARGDRVLVLGASGAVGTFTVQIAKAHGAEVTAVCGAHNAELARSIGADHVLDHRTDDVTADGPYDVIIDVAGHLPLRRLRRTLTSRGTAVVVGSPGADSLTGMRRFAGAALRSPFTRRRLVPLFSKPVVDDLATVVDMVSAGSVRPVVAVTFDLCDAAQAFRRVESGHAGGKVVLVTG